MGWSDYSINWESPDYRKADCLEGLRQAVRERLITIANSRFEENSFHNINSTFAIDRETGNISFTPDSYSSGANLVGGFGGIVSSLTAKSMGTQKLSFHRYTQMGHALDTAIALLVNNAGYSWVRWWELSNFEGMDPVAAPGDSSVTSKNAYRKENFPPIITDMADILEYIGDDQLYLFSDYGDNTKWARQKYKILNSLKMFLLLSTTGTTSWVSSVPSAMGSYAIGCSGKHDATEEYNIEEGTHTDTGDLPAETSLDGAYNKALQNSQSPYYESDGSFTGPYSFSISADVEKINTDFLIKTTSGAGVVYTKYHSGALATRSPVPLIVDVYATLTQCAYSGHGDNGAEYNSNPAEDSEQVLYGPFEGWNPLGLQSNNLYTCQYLTSYRLEPNTDFQSALINIIESDMNIPSLPTPNSGEPDYLYGDFTASYLWYFSLAITPEFAFSS